MKRRIRHTIVFLIAVLLLLAGCDSAGNTKGPETTAATTMAQAAWDSELAQICKSIPLPGGEQGKGSLSTEGSVTTGTTTFSNLKLYGFVKWIGELVQDGWYVFGNEANKGAVHITMAYSTRDETLRLTVEADSARGVWPSPVTAELDYMVPFYNGSNLVSKEELDLENYEDAFQCTFESAAEEVVLKYIKKLEDAGYRNLGQASGLYVLENGIYEVNIFLDPDGVRPVEVKLLKHTIAAVPLPPWPDELPNEFANVLPLMGSPVSTVEPAIIGYTIDVNDVSSYEVYTWYSALPGKGWSEIEDNGNAVHAQMGFLLGTVYFDSPSMTFGFTVEQQDSERTDGATAAATSGQTAGNVNTTPNTNTSGHNTGDVTYTYKLTSGKYEGDDVENAVREEFGQNASVADWTVLKRAYTGEADSFLSDIGVKHNEDVWVNCDDTGYYEGMRHYFLAKIDGVKRDDFLVHDKWDGDTVWLGSWSGIKLRALVLIASQ